MKPTCQNCWHWTGAADSERAICKRPRPVHEFALTEAAAWCPNHETFSGGQVARRVVETKQNEKTERGKQNE